MLLKNRRQKKKKKGIGGEKQRTNAMKRKVAKI